MFEVLLKSKFYTKCKSSIKMTKNRIEIIKKKRNAMQKFLKNDIADLLKSGLDVNACGRVEGLWIEMNLSSCYDFVEQFCNHVSSQLTEMNKQSKYEFISEKMAELNCLSQKNRISNIDPLKKECPDDCREAVCSLMFAAARFADLPELRDLRSLFIDRYGSSSIDGYANKEFVHKLTVTHPSKDMKLQLMQDIAAESGLEWNPKNLEQSLFKHPVYGQEYNKNDNAGESNVPETIDANYREESEHKKADDLAVREDVSQQDDLVNEVVSKPKSVRRNKKPQSDHEKVYSSEPENADMQSKLRKDSRNRNHDHQDAEDELLDKLLLHYSRKKPSDNDKPSLPVEPSQVDASKGHDRDCSQQSEALNSNAHVHPKLPEYDDFVARLAAVRGNFT